MKNHIFLYLLVFSVLIACDDDDDPPTRSYRMGFQNSAPRFEMDLVIQSLNLWTTRADAAMITTEVPWDSLLSGVSAQQYVTNNYLGLVQFYRSKNLKLWVYIDPQNGLNRASDADALVARGKSIADPDMQKIYRRFVVVMDSMLRPEHLGLALETNLIRDAATAAIYQGVKKAANDAVTDVRVLNKTVKLSISVQAETAWGKFGSSNAYTGVEQDFIDFPFMEEMGISSYPYFGFNKPGEIPEDYYERLAGDRDLDLFVTEGGWTSQSMTGPFGPITSSPETQADYIRRQAVLLDEADATAVFQLQFTDLDMAGLPSTVNPTVQFFAYLGLVDTNLQPRPSLGAWDENFKKAREED